MTDIDKLIAGYQQFYQKYFRSDDSPYQQLKYGQSPKTLIIACSDSRVDPSIITHAQPGDIFVIRNVANLVPPYRINANGVQGVSAALEFAVQILGVEDIIILGHSHCAGVAALLESDNLPEKLRATDFIGKWVQLGKVAKEKVQACAHENDGQDYRHCERELILLSLENLRSFPWIAEKTASQTLRLHGWYFSIHDGSLETYDTESQKFIPLPHE